MNKLRGIFFIFLISILAYSQESLNSPGLEHPTLFFTSHSGWAERLRTNKISRDFKNKTHLSFSNIFYLNTNLPNTENFNGYYFPKGSGSIISYQFDYYSKYFFFSFQPTMRNYKAESLILPEKQRSFSVLNDTKSNSYPINFQNTGFQIIYRGLFIGYGNWNHWWGPGIHNSIVLSNNSEGFNHYIIGFNNRSTNELSLKFKYLISDSFNNHLKAEFYLSALFLNVKYKNIELGYSRNILSGGIPTIDWGINDAFTLMFNNVRLQNWDVINDYYGILRFPQYNLEIFAEIGSPKNNFDDINPDLYSGHQIGSNLGFRKMDIFENENLFFGVEYTRLLQSSYYNKIPSANWYENKRYNYSSFKNRRWSAHAGSDSDDLLIFAGYMDENKSLMYGINYERHGVTFSFPPEVKFESRLSLTYQIKKYEITLYYENEYFEHYGFVDNNNNVWLETFEEGSLQRTKTLIFSINTVFF